jgi:sugar O-acyltransferase (sialic acid O-acetyltransferase NeuD family)
LKVEKPVIVLGNGGHASVLTEILLLTNREIIGFTSPHKEDNPFGLRYLGTDTIIEEYNSNEIELVLGLGSVNVSIVRENLFDYFVTKGFTYATLIHPSAIVSKFATIGEGVQLFAGSIIQAFATISLNTIINTGAIVEHDCTLGPHVHIAPKAVLSGNVRVGLGTHIGTGATIIQGVKVGRKVLVGAGAVVVKDISDEQKVTGVPAREMK